MEQAKISLAEVYSKRNEFLSLGLPIADAFRQFLGWLGENEKALDSSASAYFDKILENAYRVARENVAQMQDSPESRKAKRMIAKGEGGHVSIVNLLKAFERPHGYHSQKIDDWSDVLSKSQQAVADFLYDLTQNNGTYIAAAAG